MQIQKKKVSWLFVLLLFYGASILYYCNLKGGVFFVIKKIYKKIIYFIFLCFVVLSCNTMTVSAVTEAPLTTPVPVENPTPSTTSSATSTPTPSPAPAPAPDAGKEETTTEKTNTTTTTTSKNSLDDFVSSYKNGWGDVKDSKKAELVKDAVTDLKENGDNAQKRAIEQLTGSFEDKVTMMVGDIFLEIEKLNLLNSTANSTNFSTIYKFFGIVGYALVTLYLIIALVEKASTAQMTIEQFMHILLKTVLAKSLIDNGWFIIGKFYDAGLGIAKAIQVVSYGYNSSITDNLYIAMADKVYEISQNGYFENMFTSFDYSSGTIMATLCSLVAMTVMWGTIIEIVVKSVLAPLALAEIVTSGIHGTGMRYIKRLFILDLQFASIMLTTYVCGQINTAISLVGSNYTSPTMAHLAIQLVTVFGIVKSASYVNDLLKS